MAFTFDCHRTWYNLIEEQRMTIFLLAISGDGHATGEEGDVPNKDKTNGQPAVQTENLYRREGRHNAEEEGNHIRQRCDGDRYSCFR